jgi:hypothetical protein
VAIAVILLAFACRRPDYFPLKDKQEWRYAATMYEVVGPDTIEAGNLSYAIAVTGSAVEPGLGRTSEVRITRNEEPHLSFFFRKTRDAVFVLPASHLDGLEPTSGWLKLLELPLCEGAFWYGDAEHSVSCEVMVRADMETPAGRFRNCSRVTVHAAMPYLIDFWLAPDVGIISWRRRFSASRFEIAERLLP